MTLSSNPVALNLNNNLNGAQLNGAQGGALASFLSDVHPHWPAEAAALLTTLPRGGIQICHATPAGRVIDTDQRLAWTALKDGFAAEGGRLAVRLEGPVLGGYPGVILLRAASAPATPATAELADRVRAAYGRRRAIRQDLPVRQAVFVGGESVLPHDLNAAFGQSIADGLRRLATSDIEDGRHTLVDAEGRCAAVQVSRIERDVSVGEGPVVFLSLSPRSADWSELTPADFDADPELSRLTGAIQFAVEHFRRGPTLDEIAGVVGLSPFHFHRRFTERFGITPKHLLYDLQLEEAERLLSDPKRPLTEIADACGFAHQSHFTSRFKQGTGLTPTAWRRRRKI
ncbi:MAG: AraC family transcriptional regulator [Phycisphaerales bacterium]|nr:AraC family transcriptional regulator [Phycisphaerales bacterium]